MGELDIFVTNVAGDGKTIMVKIDPEKATVDTLYKVYCQKTNVDKDKIRFVYLHHNID